MGVPYCQGKYIHSTMWVSSTAKVNITIQQCGVPYCQGKYNHPIMWVSPTVKVNITLLFAIVECKRTLNRTLLKCCICVCRIRDIRVPVDGRYSVLHSREQWYNRCAGPGGTSLSRLLYNRAEAESHH